MKLKSIIETFIVVLGIVFFLKIFVIGFYYVSSDSMAYTLVEGDFILVSKLSYDFTFIEYRTPKVGDIVVVRYEGVPITKRIIAISGDKLEYDDKNIFVNGLALSSNYYTSYDDFQKYAAQSKIKTYLVPENSQQYFVAGDFLELSRDSREFGTISRDDIIGKAFYIYLSKDKHNKLRTERIGLIK